MTTFPRTFLTGAEFRSAFKKTNLKTGGSGAEPQTSTSASPMQGAPFLLAIADFDPPQKVVKTKLNIKVPPQGLRIWTPTSSSAIPIRRVLTIKLRDVLSWARSQIQQEPWHFSTAKGF